MEINEFLDGVLPENKVLSPLGSNMLDEEMAYNKAISDIRHRLIEAHKRGEFVITYGGSICGPAEFQRKYFPSLVDKECPYCGLEMKGNHEK